MRVLLTGVAGFIGYHTAKTLLSRGVQVVGVDSINDYYDRSFKHARLEDLASFEQFKFHHLDICDLPKLKEAWYQAKPTHVIHLAAQAGVRYSIENPKAYIDANIVGFQNIIDLARETKPENFVYASSSSVYGGLKEMPFHEGQNLNQPMSLYAASKMSNELVAHVYGHLFELPTTGLRFFTVYGPFSRPDMAMFKFAELMRKGKPINVYNHGNMIRDWTYITDIVSGILAVNERPALGAVYNLGKGSPDRLEDMISYLEQDLGLKAERNLMPLQAGDVPATQADISKAQNDFGYKPIVQLRAGVSKFCEWYRAYYSENFS